MFYVKVVAAGGMATTYRSLSPVKMGRSYLYEDPQDLDLDGWHKAIPHHGFDRLDAVALNQDRNADGKILETGTLEGEKFWQVKWAFFVDDYDDDYESGRWLCVVTTRKIFLLGENGKTIDRV